MITPVRGSSFAGASARGVLAVSWTTRSCMRACPVGKQTMRTVRVTVIPKLGPMRHISVAVGKHHALCSIVSVGLDSHRYLSIKWIGCYSHRTYLDTAGCHHQWCQSCNCGQFSCHTCVTSLQFQSHCSVKYALFPESPPQRAGSA